MDHSLCKVKVKTLGHMNAKLFQRRVHGDDGINKNVKQRTQTELEHWQVGYLAN